ncbi:hypothetical protein PENTCL1PPCAC_24736, partial [Pristionchus entomophagus]
EWPSLPISFSNGKSRSRMIYSQRKGPNLKCSTREDSDGIAGIRSNASHDSIADFTLTCINHRAMEWKCEAVVELKLRTPFIGIDLFEL